MTDHAMDYDLQKAIADVLLNDTGLVALVGKRIYQDVSEKPQFPYVTLGDTLENDDSVQCMTASEIFVDIHVWTQEAKFASNKKISALIKFLIHDADLQLDEQRCVQILHRVTRTFADQRPLIKHGVITFVAQTELTEGA